MTRFLRVGILALWAVALAAPALVAARRLEAGCRGTLVPGPYYGSWGDTRSIDVARQMNFKVPGQSYSLLLTSYGLRIDCKAPPQTWSGEPAPCVVRLPEACLDRAIPTRWPVVEVPVLHVDLARNRFVLAGARSFYASFSIEEAGILAFSWPRVVAWTVALAFGVGALLVRRHRLVLVGVSAITSFVVWVSIA